jgi:hypothetical protein
VGKGLPLLDQAQLLGGDRPPEFIDEGRRTTAEPRLVVLEVLGPEADSGLAHKPFVVNDDVLFGVLQQRVRVEVRRADGQPAIIDDADLCMNVDDVAQLPFPGVDGAREEAIVAVIRFDQCRHLTA